MYFKQLLYEEIGGDLTVLQPYVSRTGGDEAYLTNNSHQLFPPMPMVLEIKFFSLKACFGKPIFLLGLKNNKNTSQQFLLISFLYVLTLSPVSTGTHDRKGSPFSFLSINQSTETPSTTRVTTVHQLKEQAEFHALREEGRSVRKLEQKENNVAPFLKGATLLQMKYLSPVTTMNFSMNSSESSTAMWAARPISELALLGRAWCTSYRTRLTPGLLARGCRRWFTISR